MLCGDIKRCIVESLNQSEDENVFFFTPWLNLDHDPYPGFVVVPMPCVLGHHRPGQGVSSQTRPVDGTANTDQLGWCRGGQWGGSPDCQSHGVYGVLQVGDVCLFSAGLS